MSRITRLQSTTVSLLGAGVCTAGDELSNSTTAGSVVRATFDLNGFDQGRILGMGMSAVNATAWVVAAANFEAMLFAAADLPAAVGDNVTMPISALVRAKALAEFVFDDAGWINQLGAIGTGVSGWQYALPYVGSSSQGVVAAFATPPGGRPYSLVGKPMTDRTITVVLRSLAAYDPTDSNATATFFLDIEA